MRIACSLGAVLLLSCSPAPETSTPTSVEIAVISSWERIERDGGFVLSAPEGDSNIYVITHSDASTVEELSEAVSGLADLEQGVVPTAYTRVLSQGGWEEVWDASYPAPSGGDRYLWGRAYRDSQSRVGTLFDISASTYAKRSAEILQFHENGLQTPDFAPEDWSRRNASPVDSEMLSELENFLVDGMDKLGIAGAAYAVISDDQILVAKGLGDRTVSGMPVDEHSLFLVASLTKGMTTLLLAKAVELGKADWDDRVIDHYPSFTLQDDAATEEILLRHLVCACTGIPWNDWLWVFNADGETDEEIVFEQLSEMSPTTAFGETYQYSNHLAASAGYVVGSIFYPDLPIGEAYNRAMQEHVFDTLGMVDTTFDPRLAIGSGNVAEPFGRGRDGRPQRVEQTSDRGMNHTIAAMRPTGGAWSSVHDMARYVRNEVTAGVGPREDRLFDSEPLLERRKPGVSSGPLNARYGIGLEIQNISGIEVVRHGGAMRGYRSDILVVLGADVGAVLLTNGEGGYDLIAAFQRRLLELLFDGEEVAAEMVEISAQAQLDRLNAGTLQEPVPIEVRTRVAGIYISEDLGLLSVRQRGNELVFDTGQWSTTVALEAKDDSRMSFVGNAPGFREYSFEYSDIENGEAQISIDGGARRYSFRKTD